MRNNMWSTQSGMMVSRILLNVFILHEYVGLGFVYIEVRAYDGQRYVL